MKQKASLFLIFFLCASCQLFTQSYGKKTQAEALRHLYKAKLHKKGSIDARHFEGFPFRDESSVLPQAGLKEKDKVEKLPGQPPIDFDQYSGYVTINQTAGPGCSSLAYGAMEELGPFRVHSDGKTLYRNKYSWNNAANVLFLESPTGVGFSYSNTSSDYYGGDRKTADDNYLFILNWFERFPEYKDRDFYISGESYAGHYVPQLAHNILQHNHMANATVINLKGIMIGNAAINDETDLKGMYDYFGTHAIASPRTIQDIQKYCDFSPNATTQPTQCEQASSQVNRDIDYLNIYNIYAPLCLSSNLTSKPKKASIMNFDPCSDNYVIAYMNSPNVQVALHANVTRLSYDWQPCSDVIMGWEDSPSTVIPLLREFMANGLRVWIFSGDIDGRIPVTSTMYSINEMNLSVKTLWHPWFVGGEVGGYTEVYEGDLTFATVRGAGHQVSSYQPLRALSLVMHFLTGTSLPNTSRY
ncbi:Peptidase S10, serine carboxypeptidase [Dillenia turbinata]|uniref:Carboxypeptidase n=1 Tax=Dillenia turbinata TaxID=194707 RepID=A0AAN8VGR2_9MAGN